MIIISKVKAKMFEEMESQGERDREAQVRKEEFQKKKEMFKEGEEEIPCSEKLSEDKENGEVTKKKAVFESLEERPKESKSESSECSSPKRSAESAADEEMTEALERERRREQFLEKQTLFAK